MPMIEFLTEKRFTVSTHLIEVSLSLNLNLNEFLLLMYFEDATDKTFDVSKIGELLKMKEQDILSAFNKLLVLNLIKMETKKDDANKRCEIISLVPMYNAMFIEKQEKNNIDNKQNLFEIFQKELGRNISPIEYEIINAWLEKGFSKEIILEALKEAVFNGVNSLRYIDKILYEWQKKGYKNKEDIKNGLKNREPKEEKIELFDYNWLDEE